MRALPAKNMKANTGLFPKHNPATSGHKVYVYVIPPGYARYFKGIPLESSWTKAKQKRNQT